ncbi:MAG: cell division protein FtsZ [Saprospiraceae bacterium]|nr:cell division protein FtsZ [Saprospiraceae bacterium]
MLFDYDKDQASIIKVIGVGGGGTNAVNHMMKQGIVGVDFAICNTDAQSLEISEVKTKIQLGPYLTEGRGAGNKPEVGKEACKESIEEIRTFLEQGTKMLFVTAGMGGGTGTGAAPIIAKAAKEMDILTVGIVTIPFTFEGPKRMHQALAGIEDLKKNVDALVVISNDKLKDIFGNLALSAAFGHADNVLTTAAKGIAEIITVTGLVNVDFEDVNTVMRNSGVAIMGTAAASGEDRAKEAVYQALHSPLIEDSDIRGAKHILLNITSGNNEVTMDEVTEITNYIQDEAGYGTVLIWGHCQDEKVEEELIVTIIATGFEPGFTTEEKENKIVVELDEEEELDEITARPDHHEEYHGFEDEVYESGMSLDLEPKIKEEEKDTETMTHTSYSYDKPYVKAEEKKKREREDRARMEEESERREQLRKRAARIDDLQNISSLENEPAYKRRNVDLEEVPDSKEDGSLSRSILNIDDDSLELGDNNAYLHDNVD